MKYRAPSNDDQEMWRTDILGCRQRFKLSQTDMSKLLGIPSFRLDKIEKGVQPATEQLALKANEIWVERSKHLYSQSDNSCLEYKPGAPGRGDCTNQCGKHLDCTQSALKIVVEEEE